MKFVHYLENITGVSIYPMTSLFVFVLFFVVVTVMTLREDRASIEEQKQIPLN